MNGRIGYKRFYSKSKNQSNCRQIKLKPRANHSHILIIEIKIPYCNVSLLSKHRCLSLCFKRRFLVRGKHFHLIKAKGLLLRINKDQVPLLEMIVNCIPCSNSTLTLVYFILNLNIMSMQTLLLLNQNSTKHAS